MLVNSHRLVFSAMIASIIKTVQAQVLASPDTDPTIATVNYDRWLFIEAYLVIITASIPSVRSLLRSTNRPKIFSNSTHELSSRCAVSSSHASKTRRQDSSIDGKAMMDISEENISNDDSFRQGDHNESPESGLSRESVTMCV